MGTEKGDRGSEEASQKGETVVDIVFTCPSGGVERECLCLPVGRVSLI